MTERLETITKIINWYESDNIKHLVDMNRAIAVLTSNLYHLEVERAKYHDKYQKIIYELTKDKKTVARAENEANVLVPEMYLLRRIMSAAYRVSDSMRTNISYMKTEQNNTN